MALANQRVCPKALMKVVEFCLLKMGILQCHPEIPELWTLSTLWQTLSWPMENSPLTYICVLCTTADMLQPSHPNSGPWDAPFHQPHLVEKIGRCGCHQMSNSQTSFGEMLSMSEPEKPTVSPMCTISAPKEGVNLATLRCPQTCA